MLHALLVKLPRPLDASAPVLPTYDDPHVLTRSFARLIERLKLKDLTFHDLRHDVGSTLTMAGVSQRAVMEVLGHRDPRMTIRYQHLEPGHLRAAMGTLNAQPTHQGRVLAEEVSPHEQERFPDDRQRRPCSQSA